MPRAKTTVKAIYGQVRHSEIAPLALTFHERFTTEPTEFAPFTAYDKSVDTTWLGQFDTSIKATQRIKPASQIIREGKAITRSINDLSKTSVRLGRELTYWLKKAYQAAPPPDTDLPSFLDTFPIIAANDAMRDGDTEGMLLHLGTIQQALQPHLQQLTDLGYPSPTAYQDLYDQVNTLNTRQTNHRLAIPAGTDQAQKQRNATYAFIRQILDLNDILPNRSETKKDEYRVKNALSKMRAAKAAAKPPKGTPST